MTKQFHKTRLACLAMIITPGLAMGETPVMGCGLLDIPGERYVLEADVHFSGPGACFRVVADDVELDLNGHSIIGNGFHDAFQGVEVTAHRASVHNGTISGFGGSFPFANGVLVNGGGNARLTGLDLTENLIGALTIFADGLRMEQVNAHHNWIMGALVCGADNNIINDSQFSNNGDIGIDVQCGSSGGLIVSDNRLDENGWAGLVFRFGSNADVVVEGNIGTGNITGAYAFEVLGSRFSNNNFSHNSFGLALIESHANLVEFNRLNNNAWEEFLAGTGLAVEYSCDNEIVDNLATDNLWTGINLFQSGGNLVTENNVRDNVYQGLQIASFGDGGPCGGVGNHLTDNTAMQNGYGIRYSGESNVVHTISNNTSRRNNWLDMRGEGDCSAVNWSDNNFQTASADCIE